MTASQSSTLVSAKAPFVCTDSSRVSVNPLRRLSKTELKNTLIALYGNAIFEEIKLNFDIIPQDDIRSSVTEFNNQYSPDQVEILMNLATAIANAATVSNTRMQAVFGACSIATSVTDACVHSFVQTFGKKVLRRPLSTDNIDFFKGLYAEAADRKTGFGNVLMALMMSHEFLYHIEVGESTTGGDDVFQITPFELASRLSYSLWDSMPDEELFQLATSGALTDQTILENQVTRMLEAGPAKTKIKAFFRYWLDLNRQTGVSMDTAFLQGVNPAGLQDEMNRELDAYLDYIIWEKKGGYKELLTSRRSFARTPALAQIYGHAVPSSATQQMFFSEDRVGILLRAPVLLNSDGETHPILRGSLFRRRILCDNIALPSPDDLVLRPDEETHLDTLVSTTAERAAQMTSGQSCLACHTMLNPLGFTLEGFDGLGRFRTHELVFSQGQQVASHPVQTQTQPLLAPNDSRTVDDAVQLVTLISNGSKGPACFVKQVYRYYKFQTEDSDSNCLMSSVYESLQNPQGGGILSAIRANILNQYIRLQRVAE